MMKKRNSERQDWCRGCTRSGPPGRVDNESGKLENILATIAY
jgi:hypothetical protein